MSSSQPLSIRLQKSSAPISQHKFDIQTTASMLVNGHQESDIDYEQSFQAPSLEYDKQQQHEQQSALLAKSKASNSNQQQTKPECNVQKHFQINKTTDSSLLLIENQQADGLSSSQTSDSSTTSPSSSSSLIMDAKDLYEYSVAAKASVGVTLANRQQQDKLSADTSNSVSAITL